MGTPQVARKLEVTESQVRVFGLRIVLLVSRRHRRKGEGHQQQRPNTPEAGNLGRRRSLLSELPH